MTRQFLRELEALGYYLLPPRHELSVGHSGLIMLLRQEATATEAAFNPQALQLRLLQRDGRAKLATLRARSPFPTSRTVCAGPVTLSDDAGREARFFVFGGSMEAHEAAPGEEVYSLHSSAPILALTTRKTTAADQLAAETEALWAGLQTALNMGDEAFWHHLTRITPFRLFTASLQAVVARIESSPERRTDGPWQTLHHRLRQEKSWLQETGQWPTNIPALADLWRT